MSRPRTSHPSRSRARALLTFGAVGVCSLLAAGVGSSSPASSSAAASAHTAARGPLPFHYDLHTFRGQKGGTDVVAAVAVPVRRLGRDREDGQVRYRFDVRFVLADTVERSVIDRIDSVFVAVPRPLARRHLLHTAVELNATPSPTIQQRIVVTDVVRPGYGQLYQSDFEVPDYSGTELMISDIAFGLPGARGGWTRQGMSLALLPTSQFPESAFDVYYEVYNLPPDRPFETIIAIERMDDDDDPVVRTLFEGRSDTGDDGIMAQLRRVQSALDEGRYRITVTVIDEVDRRSASRSRLVDVQGWRRGATMVPALSKRTSGSEDR